MPLINIEYGSLASSETMNDNFSYLDNRITTVAGNLTSTASSLYSNIASLSSNVTEQFSDVNSDIDNLDTSVENLQTALNSISFNPDYANATTVSYSSGDTVGFNGWLGVRLRASAPEQQIWVAINGIPFAYNESGNASQAGYSCAGIIMVKTTDIITYGGGQSIRTIYKIPFVC